MTLRDPGACDERELTEPVDLCLASGLLNPAAVGWSRHPLHRCNLRGWGRNKRWDYWCVTTDTHVLSVTYSSIDYLSILSVWFLDIDSGRVAGRDMATPAAVGVRLPDSVAGGPMSVKLPGFALSITEVPGATRIIASCRSPKGEKVDADLKISLPRDHETLSVVVPWDERRFQFTSKHNTRPAEGTVRIGADEFTFGPHNNAYGCLDFGRGRWPRRIDWNWGSASGLTGGHVVGLQLGGKWTDGTGSTENALCIDGRLDKLSEDLVWEYSRADWMLPWSITSPLSNRVDLRFVPFYEKASKVRAGVAGTEVHQCFGRYSGTVETGEGETVTVDGMLGWAEEARMRW